MWVGHKLLVDLLTSTWQLLQKTMIDSVLWRVRVQFDFLYFKFKFWLFFFFLSFEICQWKVKLKKGQTFSQSISINNRWSCKTLNFSPYLSVINVFLLFVSRKFQKKISAILLFLSSDPDWFKINLICFFEKMTLPGTTLSRSVLFQMCSQNKYISSQNNKFSKTKWVCFKYLFFPKIFTGIDRGMSNLSFVYAVLSKFHPKIIPRWVLYNILTNALSMYVKLKKS